MKIIAKLAMDLFTIVGFAFIITFVLLAYFNPEAINDVVCFLQNERDLDRAMCRFEKNH